MSGVPLRERYVEQGQERFLPNIDALLCRIDLHAGDLDGAEACTARRRRAIRCT